MSENLDLSTLIVAVLGALGVLTRVTTWVLRYRTALRIVADVIERIAPITPNLALGKKEIAADARSRGVEVAEMLLKAAAHAEAEAGVEGKATAEVARPLGKARRFVRGIGRWLPVIGALV